MSFIDEPDGWFDDLPESWLEINEIREPDFEDSQFGKVVPESGDAGDLPDPPPLPREPTMEHCLISAIGLDLETLKEVSRIVEPVHFRDQGLRAIFEVMLSSPERISHDGEIQLQLLAPELKKLGLLDAIGGIPGLAAIHDLEASPAFAKQYAFEVQCAHVKREIGRHAGELERRPDDEDAAEMLKERLQEREEIEARRHGDGPKTGITGDALIAAAEATAAESPLPGFFDPEPSLQIVHGPAKTGKTTFVAQILMAWAAGRLPWKGAPCLPGSRALMITAEQSSSKFARLLTRIDRSADLGGPSGWKDRIDLVARRADMPLSDRELLRLDATGIRRLREILVDAQRRGQPIELIGADSLTRLTPSGLKTLDNDDMASLLDALAELAVEFGVYILLIHHAGHDTERRGKPIEGVRGASAIADVPQVLIAISREPGQPRIRRVRVAGNEVPDLDQLFEVARDDEPEGNIYRFEPSDEWVPDLDHVFATGPVGLMEFGRRALEWAPDRAASGAAKQKARDLLESLESNGLVRKEGSDWHRIE